MKLVLTQNASGWTAELDSSCFPVHNGIDYSYAVGAGKTPDRAIADLKRLARIGTNRKNHAAQMENRVKRFLTKIGG
jgi:hypothetical protein